jgi:hypothetical protein
MLIRHFDNLRQQSVEVRKRATLLYSLMFTGLIVAVWVTSLVAGREPGTMAEETEQTQTTGAMLRAANLFLEENVFTAPGAGSQAAQTGAIPEQPFDGVRDTGSSAVNSEALPTTMTAEGTTTPVLFEMVSMPRPQ